ncbi:MAG TPA: TerC/Alx family metal homeostasis membrane protein [Verrucomicrobiae bacterium]|nr:TerC/Alx family metal homeostasis membrane protein [Verrucomicrobiae bacterium]
MEPLQLPFAQVVQHVEYNVGWPWYAFLAACLAVYAFVEWKHTKSDHEIGFAEAVRWSVIYLIAGLAFSIPIFLLIGSQAGGEYLAAMAIEKALSMDNLFIISLIFGSFKVAPELYRRMLNYGIAGAIIFRLIFILVGLEALKRYEWIGVIFGLILIRAAWKAFQEARGGDELEEEIEFTDKWLWKMISKWLPVHHEFDGHKLVTKVNGKKVLTLMAAIIILIECTDLIFAVDSVPAVLAISPDRFIAYSSNVFAILGLRALFFVYQSVAAKFWALSWGLTGVLGWIGFKMVASPFGFHVGAAVSLAVLAVFLGGSIIVSAMFPRQPEEEMPVIEIETAETLAFDPALDELEVAPTAVEPEPAPVKGA